MGKRTRFEDIASIALIYVNSATGEQKISYDKAMEFDKIVNENLDNMDSKVNLNSFLSCGDDSKIYFNVTDENGKLYLVADPSKELDMALYNYIGCLPFDIIKASQKRNALNVLDLKLANGVIVKNEQQNSTRDKIVEMISENPSEFFIKVANNLSVEEYNYLKSLINDKSCINCSNGACKFETTEKSCEEVCASWTNHELIGKQRILSIKGYKKF